MGWNPFKSKTRIYVSASSTNMQGNFAARGSYLITTLVGGIVSRPDEPIATAFNLSYLKSPGVSLPNWFTNIKQNSIYPLPSSTLVSYATPSTETVAGQLPYRAGWTTQVQYTTIEAADYDWWARQYILAYEPSRANSAWIASIGDSNLITVVFPDEYTVAFYPTDFIKSANYLFAAYNYLRVGVDTDTGIIRDEVAQAGVPDTTGYILQSSTGTLTVIPTPTTTTVVTTYSDGTPTETTSSDDGSTESVTIVTNVYTKTTYTTDPDTSSVLQVVYTLTTTTAYEITESTTTTIEETTEGGVTTTVTTTVTTRAVDTDYYDLLETFANTSVVENSQSYVFIYRLGTGVKPTLDALIGDVDSFSDFFPIIPLRIDNVSITDASLVIEYAQADRIYKLLTKTSLSTLVAAFEETESLANIDYGALHFGVALNATRKEGKAYILKFFQQFAAQSADTAAEAAAFIDSSTTNATYQLAYQSWLVDVAAGTATGEDEPTRPSIYGVATVSGTTIRINSAGAANFYDVRISWDFIAQTTSVGTIGTNAAIGDVTIQEETTTYVAGSVITFTDGDTLTPPVLDQEYKTLVLRKQISANTYTETRIGGLLSTNYVYSGNAVVLDISDGLQGDEFTNPATDDTNFIIPLHYTVLMEMSLVERAQVCSECMYITANSYEAVKEKWYESSWFKVVLIIAVIVVTVYSGGAGGGAAGVLGTSAAVGAALGFVGAAAIIAGTIANAVAAMVVAAIIDKAARELFGDEVGAIIGAIVSIWVIGATSNYQAGAGFSMNIAEMSVTQLVSQGAQLGSRITAAYTQGQLAKLQEDLQGYQDYYNEQSDEIDELTEQYVASSSVDGGAIQNDFIYDRLYTASEDALITGDDIVEITHAIVYDFVDLTTKLN